MAAPVQFSQRDWEEMEGRGEDGEKCAVCWSCDTYVPILTFPPLQRAFEHFGDELPG